MKRTPATVLMTLTVAAFAAGCATTKPPSLRVAHVGVDKIGITGVHLRVAFEARNPNAEPLDIERFEYELKLAGRSLGHGYHPEPVSLDGYGRQRVESEFDVDLLRVPGAIKRVLDRDEVDAEVTGHFVIRSGSGTRKLKFSSGARVRLDH